MLNVGRFQGSNIYAKCWKRVGCAEGSSDGPNSYANPQIIRNKDLTNHVPLSLLRIIFGFPPSQVKSPLEFTLAFFNSIYYYSSIP